MTLKLERVNVMPHDNTFSKGVASFEVEGEFKDRETGMTEWRTIGHLHVFIDESGTYIKGAGQ